MPRRRKPKRSKWEHDNITLLELEEKDDNIDEGDNEGGDDEIKKKKKATKEAVGKLFDDHPDEESDDEDSSEEEADETSANGWCSINTKYLDAAARRVKYTVPRFMKVACIKDPYELSIANPPHSKKIYFPKGTFSWWKFLEQMVRNIFPDITVIDKKASRIEYGQFVIEKIVIPLAAKEVESAHELDIEQIEKELNALIKLKLLQRKERQREKENDEE